MSIAGRFLCLPAVYWCESHAQGRHLQITKGDKQQSKHESRKTEKARKNNRSYGTCIEQLSSDIIGAALAVHKELGPGFLESVYEGELVGSARMDIVVAGQVILELKAVESLRDVHFVQIKSYLRATRLHVGLLFNFNATSLTIKRIVQD
ncbi:MAG: GxxExxY protein [Gemmatimonadales bacterium]|nr:GxxExxY protein [Gemmatimonadales bacterium]